MRAGFPLSFRPSTKYDSGVCGAVHLTTSPGSRYRLLRIETRSVPRSKDPRSVSAKISHRSPPQLSTCSRNDADRSVFCDRFDLDFGDGLLETLGFLGFLGKTENVVVRHGGGLRSGELVVRCSQVRYRSASNLWVLVAPGVSSLAGNGFGVPDQRDFATELAGTRSVAGDAEFRDGRARLSPAITVVSLSVRRGGRSRR
jgi:hypothetical protein